SGGEHGRMPQAPAFIVVAAIVPPVAYALLLAAFERRRPRPWPALMASFAWGAVVAATCSARANELLVGQLGVFTDAPPARAVGATVGGPVIEEALKGAGLVLLLALRPALLSSVRDGILHGAWIGLGFDLAENLDYLTLAAVQGGTAGVLRALWVRGFL